LVSPLQVEPPHRQNKQKGQPVAADPNTTTKLIASLGYAFTYFAVAESDAELARDLTDMGQDEGTVANVATIDLDKLARAYAAAGTAAYANFNALVVDELGKEIRDLQRAQEVVTQRDPIYRLIPLATNYSESLNDTKNLDPTARASQQLGFGVFSYLFSAYLLDKWYGLSPDYAELVKNNVLTFRNERALSFQIDSAKQDALIAAAECKSKLGFVPSFVEFEFQLANGRREGDERDKLDSLLDCWHATFYAHLATLLGQH
jgi:hypothetical protein